MYCKAACNTLSADILAGSTPDPISHWQPFQPTVLDGIIVEEKQAHFIALWFVCPIHIGKTNDGADEMSKQRNSWAGNCASRTSRHDETTNRAGFCRFE
jgi:hypothetical protein